MSTTTPPLEDTVVRLELIGVLARHLAQALRRAANNDEITDRMTAIEREMVEVRRGLGR